MCMTWQINVARSRFSEVVETCIKSGPQIITRHGRNTAVIVSMEDYKRLVTPKNNLKNILISTGFDSLSLTRDNSNSGRSS